MEKSNAQILHNFYSLLLEINFHELDDEKSTSHIHEDEFIQKHLRLIKLKTARNKAELKRSTYHSLIQEIDRLRKIGVDELRKLLNPSEFVQFQPMFSKFESLSKKDQESLSEDKELLQLLDALKSKIDKPNIDG
jgi:hypothetical protein